MEGGGPVVSTGGGGPVVRLGSRRPLDAVRELWEFRELLFFFVWRDVKIRYKQTAIGIGWAIIQPLFTMVVFSLFFGRLAQIPSDGIPHALFYYSGLLPWTYFANALTNATNSVVEQRRMITKVYFPKMILPLAAVITGMVDFFFAFLVLLLLMVWFGFSVLPALTAAPVFLLLTALTALAVGLWLSALNVSFRDVRFAVPFVVQFWMFASPVAYPSSLVPPGWLWLYGLNPMAGVIDGFRWALLGQGSPPLLLPVSAAAMVVVLIGGFVYFFRLEGSLADSV